ncbi:MAG: tetratricopeptide repeat protein [Flavobacteriales bacterium]|nr:MAG: tetratricopeptide repeat protein [Flavobacteriales bacterium]
MIVKKNIIIPKNKLLQLCIAVFFIFIANQKVSSQVKKENKLLIGRIELSNKNYQQAIESFNLASANDPLNFEPYYYRAIAKVELGDIVGAANDINKAIELEPRSVDLYILRGSINDRQLNYEKAFEDYTKALSIDSRNADVYLSRAITYSNLQEYANAIKDCELALRYKSRKELVYVIRGMSELGLKNYHEAISDFNLVIENSPNNSSNYVRRATAFYYLNDFEKALTDIQKAIYLDDKNSYAYFQRSMIFNKLNRNDEALADLNKLIEISPNSTSAYYNRALLFTEKENFKAALRDYDKVINLNNKNILAYYNRAIVNQRLKRIKEAKADVEKAIELYPDFVDAYKLRASIKQTLGDYKGAEFDNQTAEIINQSKLNITDSLRQQEELFIAKITSFSSGSASINPTNTTKTNSISLLPSYKIQVLSNQKEKRIIDSWNKTKKAFTSYFLVSTNDNEIGFQDVIQNSINELTNEIETTKPDAELYLKRAILYQSIDNYTNSENDFNTSLALDSSNYIAYFSRANLFNEKNALTPSKQTIQQILNDYSKCIKENPTFSFAYFNRGNIKFQQEKYIDAIEDFSLAINANPSFAEAYFNRALILLVLENREQACKDLSKAGELGLLQAYDVIAKYCNN